MKKDAGLKSNFHTHTYRCGHAYGDIKDYTKSAISYGYKNLGISDHAFFPNIEHKGMRGSFSLLDDYIDKFKKAKKRYQNKINLFLGFEIEYMDRFEPYYSDLLSKYGFDYLILGQHITYDENGKIVPYFDSNNLNDIKNIKKYKDDLIKGMRSGKFLYVAHPDLFMIFVNSITDEIIGIMNEIVDASIECNIPLELNLGGLRFNNFIALNRGAYTYPNYVFWKIASEKGAKVVIGIDAHDPKDLSYSQKRVIDDLLKRVNLTIVDPLDILVAKKVDFSKR